MIARFLLVFLLGFCLSPNSHAVEVSAQGINQRQAINNALRQALEMEMGTDLESNTLVENFQVVRQQVLKHSQGFIESYKILHESEKDGLYSVTIDAQVARDHLESSTQALLSLMKMTNHPHIMVFAISDDFDAIPAINSDVQNLRSTIEATLRDEFKFDVLDIEATRLSEENQYRFQNRKDNLNRARRAKADFVIFLEVIKRANQPYQISLESLDAQRNESVMKETVQIAGRALDHGDIIDHIYGPSAQIASAMIETLKQEVYENGQRFEVSFYKFAPKTIDYLENDLTQLPGYVRHKLTGQEKNALALTYWSLLKAGPLHEQISQLLQAQNIDFNFQHRQHNLTYFYNDPMFE